LRRKILEILARARGGQWEQRRSNVCGRRFRSATAEAIARVAQKDHMMALRPVEDEHCRPLAQAAAEQKETAT